MLNFVIIGAPRSGTNLLRDIVTSSSSVATWPCDEINYIWRYGNASYPSDQLTSDMVSSRTKSYIRKQFEWVRKKYGAPIVVEKTCANSLRVDFVEDVLGDPKYIFIYRNGFDAVYSAMKRWTADVDFPYLVRKARFVPLFDLPIYASKYLRNRVHRIRSSERRLSTWGPRFDGIDDAGRQVALPELCAMQWSKCVRESIRSFQTMPNERVLRLSYEKLVTDKSQSVGMLERFLQLEPGELTTSSAYCGIRNSSVGQSSRQFSASIRERIEPLMIDEMRDLGYL